MILSKYHVACNIYLSAGLPVYREVLERLLKEAQQQQKTLRSAATLVHAFADTHYDRTSFHLAGSPWAITTLATSITANAMQALAPLKHAKQQQGEEHQQSLMEHPTVGIVDHISILPLDDHQNASRMTWDEWQIYYNDNTLETTQNRLPASFSHQEETSLTASASMPSTTLPSGWVAWTIGWNLVHQENIPVDVLYYGHAHPTEMPLAQVRREQTHFFRSSPTSTFRLGQCTIGAPPHFVENYNIRLTTKCSKQLARSLTKAVREKDGGLPFVEALTLPYGSQDRFEVACNLLHPQVTSSQDIDVRVAQFFWDHDKQMEEYLEVAYRVGTTEEQCQKTIQDCQLSSSRMEQLERHDEVVRQRFGACFD